MRDATIDDAAAIAAIINETIESGANTMDLTPKTASDIEYQMRSFDERECFLILERLESPIGYGIIKKYSPKTGYRFAAETSVFLRKAEIRKGYGTHLKTAVIERCRELGYHHLVARIWQSTNFGMARLQTRRASSTTNGSDTRW